jgi:hypothetical protein
VSRRPASANAPAAISQKILLTFSSLRTPLIFFQKERADFLLGSALQVFARSGGTSNARGQKFFPSNFPNFCPPAKIPADLYKVGKK